MSTSGFHKFDPNFHSLQGEADAICKEVDKTLEAAKSADIHELLTLEYRLIDIGDRVTAYLAPAEL